MVMFGAVCDKPGCFVGDAKYLYDDAMSDAIEHVKDTREGHVPIIKEFAEFCPDCGAELIHDEKYHCFKCPDRKPHYLRMINTVSSSYLKRLTDRGGKITL